MFTLVKEEKIDSSCRRVRFLGDLPKLSKTENVGDDYTKKMINWYKNGMIINLINNVDITGQNYARCMKIGKLLHLE